jgi:uncharacterized membrane protein
MGSNEPSGSSRRLPADLAAALLATGLVNIAVFAPVVSETPARVPLGIAFLLFVPGYVVVAALFPTRSDIDGVDRVSLSVVASVIAVPTVGLVMNLTPWGIRLGPMLVAVSLLVVGLTALATRRRLAVPPAERFRASNGEWLRRGGAAVRPDGIVDLALTLSLAVAVLFAVGVVGFAIADSHAGYGPDLGDDEETMAALSLLDSDGDLLTDESPDATLESGATASVFVGVDNHGNEPRSYTIVALEQELTDDNAVADERELERLEVSVDDGERETVEHELEPTADDGRIVWLLYPEEVPEEPSTDSADAHVSLTVSDEETDG